ncbi:hypothetical protein DFJ74DRAFT_661512 [Hyaloraphidium curvatum]|nr:hypothetical protein DFJ74DRAFT_661512 [Hyaloraphidium curvatum]
MLAPGAPLVKGFPDKRTIYEGFWNGGHRINPDGPCLGTREEIVGVKDGKVEKSWGPYRFQTYRQVGERITAFGSGLLALYAKHVGPDPLAKQWGVGVYGINRPEWTIAEHALYAYSLYPVALYDTLGPDAGAYIVQHSELPIVVAGLDKIAGLLSVASAVPGLKCIVSMDPLDSGEGRAVRAWGRDKGIEVVPFGEVEKLGIENKREHKPPKPEDIMTVMYTSGTTGNPKGVVLSHLNLAASLRYFSLHVPFSTESVHISFLPLAHIYERNLLTAQLFHGGSVGYFHGSTPELLADVQALRPTHFPMVPRLMNRIYQTVMNSLSGVRGRLFRMAVDSKVARIEGEWDLESPLWDWAVLDGARKMLGGRVEFMMVGAAPIAPEVLGFFRTVFKTEVIEAYGMTESTGGGCTTSIGDYGIGSVGGPSLALEIRLCDVDEMNYRVTDKPYPRGEICIRGNGVMQGYLKEPAKTAETIDDDGFIHTGDIGQIDERGRLWVFDRKKHVFKLSQGEYVAPEKIEAVYLRSLWIAQIYVYGEMTENELVAVVVPDFDLARPFLSAQGITGTPAELAQHPALRKKILEELERTAEQYGLRGFERVREIQLESEIPAELLTPTMKMKRAEMAAYHKETWKKLYKAVNARGKAKL